MNTPETERANGNAVGGTLSPNKSGRALVAIVNRCARAAIPTTHSGQAIADGPLWRVVLAARDSNLPNLEHLKKLASQPRVQERQIFLAPSLGVAPTQTMKPPHPLGMEFRPQGPHRQQEAAFCRRPYLLVKQCVAPAAQRAAETPRRAAARLRFVSKTPRQE